MAADISNTVGIIGLEWSARQTDSQSVLVNSDGSREPQHGRRVGRRKVVLCA